MKRSDVIIIGAGPAGLSLANTLSSQGLECCVVEKQSEKALKKPAYDGREIALTHFSKRLLQEMGVWDRFPKESIGLIREAKVLDGTSPYAMHFDHEDVAEDHLGTIISNHNIRTALYEEVKTRKSVALLCGHTVDKIKTGLKDASVTLSNGKELCGKLIVAADSRFSSSRSHMGISTSMQEFGKVAIVCKATHERPHNKIAYECFLYGGTLAVLPLVGKESSIVITLSPEKAEELMTMNADRFSADVTQQFGSKLGKMNLSSERFSYPLVATYADQFFATRFAVVGDAAIGMHPVTAHGYNLGLKGQYILASEIEKALKRRGDIGANPALQAYETKLRTVSKPLYLGTNFLVRLYTDERPLHKLARKVVLRLGNNITPAKKAILNQLTETKHFA